MRKPKKEIQLTSYDELLGINEAEQNTLNQIVEVPLNELHPFRNHPFHVNDDEKMAETREKQATWSDCFTEAALCLGLLQTVDYRNCRAVHVFWVYSNQLSKCQSG